MVLLKQHWLELSPPVVKVTVHVRGPVSSQISIIGKQNVHRHKQTAEKIILFPCTLNDFVVSVTRLN